jgi:hypothetical protein
MEREHPKWDVDNISKEAKSRSVINSYKKEEPKKPEARYLHARVLNEWDRFYPPHPNVSLQPHPSSPPSPGPSSPLISSRMRWRT